MSDPSRPPDCSSRAQASVRSVLLLCWRDTGHPQGGGSETYLQRIGTHLAQSGVRVTLRTARYPGAARREVVDYTTPQPSDGARHLELTADWNTPNGTANGGVRRWPPSPQRQACSNGAPASPPAGSIPRWRSPPSAASRAGRRRASAC